MSIDEKALKQTQDDYADAYGKYKDVSIRTIIEAYEAAKSAQPNLGCRSWTRTAWHWQIITERYATQSPATQLK